MAITDKLTAEYLASFNPNYSPAALNPYYGGTYNKVLHLDDVYLALIIAAQGTEHRVEESLENYIENPDVQATLQQPQYHLQAWHLALTPSHNSPHTRSDALKSIVSNLR